MSAHYQTLARLTAWSLLMAFGIGVPFGWASGAGSVMGAVLGILIHGTSRLDFMKWRIPSTVISPVILVAIIPVLGLLTDWLPLGLAGVLLINFLLGALFATVVVPLAMLPGRFLDANPVEAIVAGLVGSLPFAEASGGHFEKPRWFADLVMGGGGNPPHFLAWTGGVLILVAIFGTMAFALGKDGKKPDINSLVGALLLMIGTGVIVYFLASIFPPVSSCPIHPPRPPMSFAGIPPPPLLRIRCHSLPLSFQRSRVCRPDSRAFTSGDLILNAAPMRCHLETGSSKRLSGISKTMWHPWLLRENPSR